MNSVRAIMSDVENNYGYEKEYDGVVIEYELSPEFINKQHRDAIVESINAPMKEYFELLKARAAELPHQPKKRRKWNQINY